MFTLLILFSCLDMDDILVLCMTASHLLDYMFHVYAGHTCISLVSVDLTFLIVCLIGDLLLLVCFSTELVTRIKV